MKYIHKSTAVEAIQWDGHWQTRQAIMAPEFNLLSFDFLDQKRDGQLVFKDLSGQPHVVHMNSYVLSLPDVGLQVVYEDGFEENYIPVQDYQQPNYSSVEQLTILQEELGYKKGEISTVAMLGLVGEAGEVLSEIGFIDDCKNYALLPKYIETAKNICAILESYKKSIRREERGSIPKFTIEKDREQAFDSELADNLYYLTILATNRGLTIFDLAQMAHDKVRAKQSAGGSSEDPKNK